MYLYFIAYSLLLLAPKISATSVIDMYALTAKTAWTDVQAVLACRKNPITNFYTLGDFKKVR